jgi:TrpR-related protein YerC/YecD
MVWNSPENEYLVDAFLALKDRGGARRFLRDLLTEDEINEFARRLNAAKMLSEKRTYSSIVKATGLSSTTVARVSKYLKKDNGGYRSVLARLHRRHPLREEAGGG